MKKCMSILTIIALLCTMLGVSQLVFAQAEEEGLSLASLSDIHYLDEGSMGGKNAAWQAFERGNAKQLEQTPALLESAFAQIARDMQESDFPYLLVAGDLTREGEYNAHVELAARLERFQRETGIPVFVTNGNHDINNSLALDFSSGKRETGRITTQAEFREIYQNLGFNRAVSSYTPPAGKQAGGLSYAADLGKDYRLIVMDVSKYSADNTASGKAEHETGGYMTPELLHWVLAQCEQAKAEGRSPLGMIHHSLVPHNGLQEPLFQNFILDNWREVTPALAKAGMRFTVTGHYHMDDTAVYRGKNHTMLYDMMSSSLSNFPNQYRMLRVANGKMFVDAVDCDRDAPITTAEQSYAQPYKYSFSFYRSFGENGLAAFGTQMIEQQLADLLKQVRKAGGTLNALQAAGVDPAQLLTQVFGTGLQLNGRELFSVNTNLMSFVKDFFAQLDELLLEDADYLNELLLNALDGLLNIQVSKKPCTAFIDTLGFGDKTKPGTFGDLVYSTLAYIYQGNEKPQEDAFYQDALAWLRNGGGSKLLQKIGRAVTEQILLDGVFTKIQFRPGTLFPQDAFAAEMGVFLEKLTLQWLYNDPSYSKLLHTLLPQKGSEKAANCPDPVGYLLAGAISLFVFDQSQDYGMQLALPSLSSSAPVVAAQAKKTAVATAAKAVTRPQTTKAAQTVQEELQETTEIIHLPSYQQADAGNLKAQATVMQENKLHRAAPFGLWSLLAAAILLLFFAGLRYSKRDKKVD